MQSDPPSGVSAAPLIENVLTWNAVIIGPKILKNERATSHTIIHMAAIGFGAVSRNGSDEFNNMKGHKQN